MKHLGDITKINGYTAPPVDVIIGGSPCQDLSVAGKRAGLDGERSGLFMEQIRIIKEMRRNDVKNGRTTINIRPRFMVWENVPGAFSSNDGEDFRVVLEETAKVADKNANIPRPANGKWPTAGCIVADGYSIAWRCMDAQYWGVPQRRRRIALVADFGGQSAPKILFKPESLSRYFNPSGTERESSSEDAGGCSAANDRPSVSFQERAGKPGGGKGILIQDDHTGALSTDPNQFVVDKDGHPKAYDARGNGDGKVVNTVTGDHEDRVTDYTGLVVSKTVALEGNGQRPSHGGDGYSVTDKEYTLNTTEVHGVAYGIDQQGGKGMVGYGVDVCPTICSDSHGTPHGVAYGISAYDSNAMKSDNPNSGIYKADTSRTLDLNGGNPCCNQGGIAIVDKEECYTLKPGMMLRFNNKMEKDKCVTLDTAGGTT